MPKRLTYWRARASSTSSVGKDGGASRRAQRPVPMGARNERALPARGRFRFSECMRLRRPAKPSPVTSPAETSSQRASSTSMRSRRTRAAISSVNDAPPARSWESTSRAGDDSPASSSPSRGSRSQPRFWRRRSVMGTVPESRRPAWRVLS